MASDGQGYYANNYFSNSYWHTGWWYEVAWIAAGLGTMMPLGERRNRQMIPIKCTVAPQAGELVGRG